MFVMNVDYKQQIIELKQQSEHPIIYLSTKPTQMNTLEQDSEATVDQMYPSQSFSLFLLYLLCLTAQAT